MIKFAGIAVVALTLTQSLQATQITGAIGFGGGGIGTSAGVTFNTGSAGNASAVTSWINPTVSGVSGQFVGPVLSGMSVNFAPGSWNFNTASTINPFWSVGGFTFQLLASAIVSQGYDIFGNGFVVVSGVGSVAGNGFTATPMSWSFTSQDPASGSNPTSWTFSASANATPVPDGGATLMLLGIALSGVALLKNKLTA